jgi:hypothetical protein
MIAPTLSNSERESGMDGARAKLERAQHHVEELRREIGTMNPDPTAVPLGRAYEPEREAIVWRIEKLPLVGQHWGLLVGDALHNSDARWITCGGSSR